jgi:endonuclease YncB( thermonuclease family)
MKTLTLGLLVGAGLFLLIKSRPCCLVERGFGGRSTLERGEAGTGVAAVPFVGVVSLGGQDPYGGGGGGGVPVFTGPSAEEMARAREMARAKSARIAAERKERRERLKRLAGERKDGEKAERPVATVDQADAKAASMVRMGTALERSNRNAAIDYYVQALKASPESAAAEGAKERLRKLGVDPEVVVLPTFEVLRVVDGGTLVIRAQGTEEEEETVRLVGVKAPGGIRPAELQERLGRDAVTFLTKLLARKKVAVEREVADDAVDKEGRALVCVYRMPDGLAINRELVRQGQGQVDYEFPFEQLAEYEKDELAAREARKGLWAAAKPGAAAAK